MWGTEDGRRSHLVADGPRSCRRDPMTEEESRPVATDEPPAAEVPHLVQRIRVIWQRTNSSFSLLFSLWSAFASRLNGLSSFCLSQRWLPGFFVQSWPLRLPAWLWRFSSSMYSRVSVEAASTKPKPLCMFQTDTFPSAQSSGSSLPARWRLAAGNRLARKTHPCRWERELPQPLAAACISRGKRYG